MRSPQLPQTLEDWRASHWPPGPMKGAKFRAYINSDGSEKIFLMWPTFRVNGGTQEVSHVIVSRSFTGDRDGFLRNLEVMALGWRFLGAA